MNEIISNLLHREIKMTMGCTDPGSVAYAASKAASMLEGELERIEVTLSPGLYKNAVYVGIPVIKKYGIEYAALLGALIKKPERKLEVLGEINDRIIEIFNASIDKIQVNVKWEDIGEPLYICVKCISNTSSITVTIMGDYDFISYIDKDDIRIYSEEPVRIKDNIPLETWDFKEIYQTAIMLEEHDSALLLEYEGINRHAALSVLPNDTKKYLEQLLKEQNLKISDIASLARFYVFNASKRRMTGEKVPIVSIAGSGNLGITTILTVSAVCDAMKVASERRTKALCLAVLTAIYIKSHMNRVTVICGTAIAAAAGAAAAMAYLLDGGYEESVCAVNTVIGSIGGVLCDGAKESCAFKVGFAAECAVVSGFMAANHAGIQPGSGIITGDIDKNIRGMGCINNNGMRDVDKIILNMILQQKELEVV